MTSSPNVAWIRSAVVIGIDAHLVDAEATQTSGTPGMHLYGLAEAVTAETRDRVRAAILNTMPWPSLCTTIGLLPAGLPKPGSGLDLAIAVAVLACTGEVPVAATAGKVFLAELGLDGALRPVRGVLPAALAAARAGQSTIVVAAQDAAQADLAEGITVVGAGSLGDVVEWLNGAPAPAPTGAVPSGDGAYREGWVDLADLSVTPGVRRALEASAAGAHHLSLRGPSARTHLALSLPALLPDLDHRAAIEVSAIHSAAGLLEGPLITRPPFRAPIPPVQAATLIGGGTGSARPGELSLAHHGILHLADAAELSRSRLESLHGPLDTGRVEISRSAGTVSFPAAFTLVLTSGLCACVRAVCRCAPADRLKYQARLPGMLMARIDIKADVTAGDVRWRGARSGEPSAVSKRRVALARERAARRLAATPWRTNAQIPALDLRRQFLPPRGTTAVLEAAHAAGAITQRGAERTIRLAWTLADLDGRDVPNAQDVTDAYGMWSGGGLQHEPTR